MALTPEQQQIVEDATRDQTLNTEARQRAYAEFLGAMRPTIKSQMRHWMWPRGATLRASAGVANDSMRAIAEQLKFDLSSVVLDVMNEIEKENEDGEASVE